MASSMGPLIQWCSSELSTLLGGDASEDFAKYLLAIDNPTDLQDYLQELLDIADPKTQTFIQELVQKKQGTAPPENVTVYKKPLEDQDYVQKSSKTQAKSRNKEKKQGGFTKVDLAAAVNSEPRMPGDPPAPVSTTNQMSDTQANKQGAKRKQKYISLYSKEGEARSVVHLAGRHWCECQAQKHALVANCLKCGRVVCAQEGSGPCLFCETLVCTREEQEILARNSKASEKLRRKLMGEGKETSGDDRSTVTTNGDLTLPLIASKLQAGLETALKHKDRLIEYDRTSTRRTKVIDDESDYFATDTNKWLTKEERAKLGKRQEELREQKHGSRLNKKTSITLDFAGRKVVENTDTVNMYDGSDEVVQAVNFGSTSQYTGHGRPNSDIVNPNITQDAPLFVQSREEQFPLPNSTANLKSERLSSGTRSTNLRIQDRELMEMSDEGFCLSMHQPWASLLVTGIKKHEGRTWYSSHRGRLWIAATSQQPTQEDIAQVESAHSSSAHSTCFASDSVLHKFITEGEVAFPKQYPIACLLGCVDMVDCLSQEQYQEQFPHGDSSSSYVFICENPQELVVRFPIKGKHKIWKLDGQILKAAKKGLRKPKDH